MTTDEGRSEGEDMSDLIKSIKARSEFFHNPDYVKAGFPGHLIEPLAVELEAAADLLEANAAEIATANALMDDMCTRIEGLEAENEKLRAATVRMREALSIIADHYIPDWHPGLTHETGQRFAKIAHKALAAVEQSEAPSRLNVSYEQDGSPVIREVFSGAYIETAEGNRVGFCMRDDTIEFNVLPKTGGSQWFRIDMQELVVSRMGEQSEAGDALPSDCPDCGKPYTACTRNSSECYYEKRHQGSPDAWIPRR